jgi:hypothetical protein
MDALQPTLIGRIQCEQRMRKKCFSHFYMHFQLVIFNCSIKMVCLHPWCSGYLSPKIEYEDTPANTPMLTILRCSLCKSEVRQGALLKYTLYTVHSLCLFSFKCKWTQFLDPNATMNQKVNIMNDNIILLLSPQPDTLSSFHTNVLRASYRQSKHLADPSQWQRHLYMVTGETRRCFGGNYATKCQQGHFIWNGGDRESMQQKLLFRE